MYSHLSKKEKKKRLAQARKRAILWSLEQQNTLHQRKTNSKVIKSSTTNTASQQKTTGDSTLFQTGHSYFTPVDIPEENTETIQAIKRTLQDLLIQKEAIDTTIAVLEDRLKFLLNTKTPK